MTLSPEIGLGALALLFFAGFAAGLIDAMAGGGGLISLPALLNLGFSAPLALGTNKLQGSFGSVTAAVHFARGKVVDVRTCLGGIAWTSAGALAGAWAAQRVEATLLGKVIPWLLAVIVLYMMLKPDLGKEAGPAKWPRAVFFGVFGVALGFYDGFFGPGVGSFWTASLILLLGMDFVKAAGHARTMNAASNVVALGLFAFKGQVVWGAGLTMAGGQFLGSRLGAGLAMKKGSRFVKPLFLTMVCLTIGRLVWVNYCR